MGKQLLCVLFLFFSAQALLAQDYTVILKNGKIIKGTMVSESDSTIVLRDEHGIQFSLKKALMDLDKMKEANQAPPPPPPPAPEPPAKKPEGKKPARVYSTADMEALREKYGDLSPGQVIIEDEEGVLASASYYAVLQESATKAEAVLNYLRDLTTGMATTWEVAASTGKDPQSALNEFMTSGAGLALSGVVENQLTGLESTSSRLARAPKGYEQVPPIVTQINQGLRDVYSVTQRYGNIRGFAKYQTDTQNLILASETAINSLKAIEEVVGTPPPEPAAAPAAPPEEPVDVTDQEPPSVEEQ